MGRFGSHVCSGDRRTSSITNLSPCFNDTIEEKIAWALFHRAITTRSSNQHTRREFSAPAMDKAPVGGAPSDGNSRAQKHSFGPLGQRRSTFAAFHVHSQRVDSRARRLCRHPATGRGRQRDCGLHRRLIRTRVGLSPLSRLSWPVALKGLVERDASNTQERQTRAVCGRCAAREGSPAQVRGGVGHRPRTSSGGWRAAGGEKGEQQELATVSSSTWDTVLSTK